MMLDIFRKKANKVIDSSVFIDGRILGVLESGFLEGDIIIPLFILEEMQRLGDSRDHEKRQKGRSGLETAKRVQSLAHAEIWNKKVKEVEEAENVDTKLVLLSRHLGAKILTLDRSLNEIAKIHGVPVMSIHELYLSVRPKLLRGDEIFVKIDEAGTEPGQGRGDFEGTMICVDGGLQYLGQRIKVKVRTALGTDAGILVFAKPVKRDENAIQEGTAVIPEH